MIGIKGMEPDIVLAPGADDTALAVMLAEIIRINIESKPEKIKDFKALKARIYIHAVDAEAEITLDFAQGKLTLYSGKEGLPQIAIVTNSSTLLDLTNIKIKGSLPYFFDQNGRAVTVKLCKGDLKIQGLVRHLFALIRLTRVLSVA